MKEDTKPSFKQNGLLTAHGSIQEARQIHGPVHGLVHGHPIHGHPIHGHPVPGYVVLTDTDHLT